MMMKEKTENPQKKECPEFQYDDGNIPEIDLPGKMNATDVIPDEVPRRDGPGGN